MDFKSYLRVNAQTIDEKLDEILSKLLKEIKKTNIKLLPLALGLYNSCKGGKRIRGTLVKLGYEIAMSNLKWQMSNLQHKDIIKIAAAFEILHTAILIHDDIIDKSPTRRGQKTLYRALGRDHYGISQAISIGDVGLYLPIKIISESKFLHEYKIKALKHISETIINTAWGEVLDVELPHLGEKMEEEDVIAIHKLKTAQYTISGPLILGAILGGASEKLLEVLGQFGKNLGIAFQIQDDILGVFGEEKSLGKSITSDIEEGKNTLLIAYALKQANSRQKRILGRFYGSDIGGIRGLEAIRKVFIDTLSLDYCRQKGVKYINEAKKVIPKITGDNRLSRILTQMADFLIERNN